MKLVRSGLTILLVTIAAMACLAQDVQTSTAPATPATTTSATPATPAAAPATPTAQAVPSIPVAQIVPAPAPLPKPSVSDVVQMMGSDAKIDWSIFQFRAVGIGFAQAGTTGATATATAREAAIVVAERNLLKDVVGVHVTSNTTVTNLVMTSDEIKTHVEGALQGAVIVSEKDMEDGSYMVVLALPLLGQHGVAQAIDLPKQAQAIAPATEVTMADVPASEAVSGNFTGLLIDCRGLKISPAMSPIVLDPDDATVYPRNTIPAETMISDGVVAYYKSVASAKQANRVGAHPLVIKASGLKKDGNQVWYTSPIVSQADAARIVAEDARSGFMAKMAVGFIID